jgi:hypothetical protein
MRTVYFFISLFFFLLGGTDAHAATQPMPLHRIVKHDVARNHHGKFVNKDLDSTVIDDTDLDLDEESHTGNFKDCTGSKCLIVKYNAPHVQYQALPYLNHYFTQSKNLRAYNSHSSPIYIVNRVIRI